MSSALSKVRLGPFLLASEIPLPELEPPTADSAASKLDGTGLDAVSIRIAPVPQRIEGVVVNESRWWASHHEYLQRVPGVANFLVRHGREILVEPAPNAPAEEIRAYLFGPIFSALCHQAGMYSLHASAIRVGDGVVALPGNSRAGKSTLAACLARRGYSVIADDTCLLDARSRDADSRPVLVIPVAPALKLWRSALDHLGTPPDSLPRVVRHDDKFRLKLAQTDALPVRLPLRQIYFLEWSKEDDAQTTIAPVEGVAAVTRLMEFTHCNYLMKATGRQTGNFLLCGQILGEARAYALSRPSNFSRIEQTLDALEAHFAAASK